MAKKDRRQKHAANTNGEALVLQVERREGSTLLALFVYIDGRQDLCGSPQWDPL